MQNPHSSRRAGAAAAAAAAEIRPINQKRAAGKQPMAATAAPKAPRTAPSASSSQEPALPALAEAALPSELAGLSALEADGAPPVGGTGRMSKPSDAPPPPLPRDENGHLHLLQSGAGIDADELHGEQERALSSYLKLHPVLSLESTSHKTMQLMADLVEKVAIPTRELEIVPKSHDDLFLAPPNQEIGERPCCLGNRCISVWLARWRYGDATDFAFICKEFLLPSQLETFKQKGTLPSPPGKCLLCTRYVQNYIYRCARADPTFKPDTKIALQAFGNALGVESGDNVPSHASVVHDADGYRSEVLLFVDESWADTEAARGSMSSLLWRPVVRFCSNHYHYVKDASGLPRVVQRNVGAASEAMESHFGQPTSAMGAGSSATSHAQGGRAFRN
jgi:hypothetical protein